MVDTANSTTAIVRMYGNHGSTVPNASDVIVTPCSLSGASPPANTVALVSSHICGLAMTIVSAVMVQTTTVSMNGSSSATRPSVDGFFVFTAECAIGAEPRPASFENRSEEHTSELQSRENLVCRLLLEKKK